MKDLLTKIKETVGRKLASLILGPMLAAMLAAVNAFLPESVQWTGEQMAELVQWIIAMVITFITAQGWVDKTKAGQMPQGNPAPSPYVERAVKPVPTAADTGGLFNGPMSNI